MSNFEYYKAKAIDLKRRLQWIEQCIASAGKDHQGILSWLKGTQSKILCELTTIDKLVQKGHPRYLTIIMRKHVVLEMAMWEATLFAGTLMRERINERRIAKVVDKSSRELLIPLNDFLVSIGDGPAVVIGKSSNPLFHFRDESLGSAYTWVAIIHEIGHVAIRQDRQDILSNLIGIVHQHFRTERNSIGPVNQDRRTQIEKAISSAEDYWTRGSSSIRLEELFCDCFATYTAGLAYIFKLLDLGIWLVDYPRYIDLCDEHPPLLARFEACWHILPDAIKSSDFGISLDKISTDYLALASSKPNPELQYGTVCKEQLINALTDECVRLIRSHWPALQQYQDTPALTSLGNAQDTPLAQILNFLFANMLRDQEAYFRLEEQVIIDIFNT